MKTLTEFEIFSFYCDSETSNGNLMIFLLISFQKPQLGHCSASSIQRSSSLGSLFHPPAQKKEIKPPKKSPPGNLTYHLKKAILKVMFLFQRWNILSSLEDTSNFQIAKEHQVRSVGTHLWSDEECLPNGNQRNQPGVDVVGGEQKNRCFSDGWHPNQNGSEIRNSPNQAPKHPKPWSISEKLPEKTHPTRLYRLMLPTKTEVMKFSNFSEVLDPVPLSSGIGSLLELDGNLASCHFI